MPVYLDKKTKRLFIQFKLNGQPYKERLPDGVTRKQAETIEVRVKSQMLFEQHGIETHSKNEKFERFVQDVYLPALDGQQSKDSFEKAIHICKAAMPYFKGKRMRDIKPHDIDRFKRSRMELKTLHGTTRKPATIHRELSIISKIFSLAVRNDICPSNPVSKIDKPVFDNIQDAILKPEDEARFLEALPSEWVRDICSMVLHTGLRFNDVMSLTRFQCDLENSWIRLTQGKTKRIIDIRITSAIRPLLVKRIDKYKDGPLFPSPRSKGEGQGSVRHTMLRTCKKLEIAPLTIRDLRRTFGTRIQPLTDTVTAARMMGHSDLRSIHRYQRSLEKIAEVADSMAADATRLPTFKLIKSK